MSYVGRFAPSPTGPLHFGSLVAALGSWLDARANNGRWLVRVEDLDPPREIAGATELILRSLQAHGLEWDGELLYQSDRLKSYDSVLKRLIEENAVYRCYCTRRDIKAQGGLHLHCVRDPADLSSDEPFAWRLRVESNEVEYHDCFHGKMTFDSVQANEDFILQRKDGLHAYMLAMVVDDIYQDVTNIIRGSDLAHSTSQQAYLFQLLGCKPPVFGHLPMALHDDGNKLSKQTHAPALDNKAARDNLFSALKFLNQPLPVDTNEFASLTELLDWGILHWNPDAFRGLKEKIA